MKTEKQLQDYMKKEANKHHVGFYKLECVGQTGFPDVMLVYKGYVVFVELKSPAGTGRISPRQELMIDRLRYQGVPVYVCDNKELADEIIESIINR